MTSRLRHPASPHVRTASAVRGARAVAVTPPAATDAPRELVHAVLLDVADLVGRMHAFAGATVRGGFGLFAGIVNVTAISSVMCPWTTKYHRGPSRT